MLFRSDIRNNIEIARSQAKTSVGVVIMLLEVLSMIFFFMLLTLFSLLSEYIRRQNRNITTLFTLGASKKIITKIYMRQAMTMVFLSLVSSLTVGISLSVLFFNGSGYHLIINPFVVTAFSLAVGLILFSFIIPIRLGLKRQLKKL